MDAADYDRAGFEATFHNLAGLFRTYVGDDEDGQALAQTFVLAVMLLERDTPLVVEAWRESFAPFVAECELFEAVETEPEGELN